MKLLKMIICIVLVAMMTLLCACGKVNDTEKEEDYEKTEITEEMAYLYLVEEFGELIIVGYSADCVEPSDIAASSDQFADEMQTFVVDEENVVIPEMIDDLPVVYVDGGAFMYCDTIKSVTIKADVYIEPGAFDGCREDLVIYGYSGSDVEEYANEYGIEFSAIEN